LAQKTIVVKIPQVIGLVQSTKRFILNKNSNHHNLHSSVRLISKVQADEAEKPGLKKQLKKWTDIPPRANMVGLDNI